MERGFATSGQGADGYVEDRRHALGEEGVRERGGIKLKSSDRRC